MPSQPLDGTDVIVLLTLWRRKRGGEGQPLTIKAIHAILRTERGDASPSRSAVKKAVTRLLARELKIIAGRRVPRDSGQTGPPPMGFSIMSRQIITWPSTATILLELFHYPSMDSVELERFLDHIAVLNLVHDETQNPMSRKELEEQITYCAGLGYVAAEATPPPRMRVLDRINEERLFLEGISNRPRKSAGGAGATSEQLGLPKQG
jgi:hypothetical protein